MGCGASTQAPPTRSAVEEPYKAQAEADRKALQAILNGSGNHLVPISVPKALGQPIARCVTQRRIKVEQSTGELAEHNAFKSRHCVDGGFLKVQQSQLSKLAGATETARGAGLRVSHRHARGHAGFFVANAVLSRDALSQGPIGGGSSCQGRAGQGPPPKIPKRHRRGRFPAYHGPREIVLGGYACDTRHKFLGAPSDPQATLRGVS